MARADGGKGRETASELDANLILPSPVLVHSSRTLYQVQHMLGKAFFEMADYPRAQKALEDMQQVGRGGGEAGREEGEKARTGWRAQDVREAMAGRILAQLGVSSNLKTPYLYSGPARRLE